MYRRFVIALSLVTAATTAQSATRFVPLGAFPGGNESSAMGISADGTVVVGMAGGEFGTDTNSAPYRWTEATGMQRLTGELIDDYYKQAYPSSVLGVSGDGRVVYGEYAMAPGTPFYKWTAENGFEALFPGAGNIQVLDANYDGTKFIATPGDNVQDQAISADGTVKVGSAVSLFGGREAYRDYIGDCGCMMIRQWLGDLPGGIYESAAYETNYSGQIVVGSGNAYTYDNEGKRYSLPQPMWWSAANGMNPAGNLFSGVAYEVSDTGQVIGGDGADVFGIGWRPFRWTMGEGSVPLADLLLAAGIDLAEMGWDLNDSSGMSANGRFFIGTGRNPAGRTEAWFIELDIPGDFNGDGPVDGADFLLWQRDGADEAAYADWLGNYWSPLTPLAPAAAGAVPEPAGAALALVALMSLAWAARRP